MSAALPRKRARMDDTTNEGNVPGSSADRPRSAGGSSPLALHPPKWRSQVDLKPLSDAQSLPTSLGRLTLLLGVL